jgi:PAS domain S-box-containing protein
MAEAYTQDALKTAQDAIFIQKDLHFVYLNEAAVRLFGATSAAQLIGRPLMERVPAAQRAMTERRLHHITKTRESLPPAESTWLRIDGSTVDVAVTSAVLQPGTPEESIIVFASDIASRRHTASRLQQREDLLRTLYRTTPDPVGIVIQDTIVEANPAMCELLGYSMEALSCLPTERLHDNQAELLRVRHAIQSQCAGGGIATVSTQWRRQDGQLVDIVLRSKHLYPDQPHLGRLFAATDVTWERQAQRTLARSEAELQAIHDGAPIAMLLLDRHARCRRLNRRARELFAFDDPQAIGKTIHQLLGVPAHASPDASTELLERALDDARQGRATHRAELHLKIPQPGNTPRDAILLISATPIPGDSEDQILLCLEDITEQKRLAEQIQQAQRTEILGQLAGGIAHDFNNTLAALTLHLDLLQTHPEVSPSLSRELEELKSEVRHGTKLTRQLLLFSRKQAPCMQAIDLSHALLDVKKMIGHLLGSRIRLALSTEATPLPIVADLVMIEQIVMNLCINARDSMAEGGTLAVRTFRLQTTDELHGTPPQPHTGTWACLSVADTGCGMPPSTLHHIFEPFFTTKGPQRGTGLGLATVHNAIATHHGWIDVTSTPGVGSTFTVGIPLAPVPPSVNP